jgi:hypothetical protein
MHDRLIKSAERELALLAEFKREDYERAANRTPIPGTSSRPKEHCDLVRDVARAIAAAAWQEQTTSISWAKRLPLTFEACNILIDHKLNELKLLGYFGRSMKWSGWDIERHPDSSSFACGVMDWILGPMDIRMDSGLRQMFPPKPLAGLATPLHWHAP